MTKHVSEYQKIKIQAICDFVSDKKLPYSHSDIFKEFGVSKSTGWRILSEPRYVDGKPRSDSPDPRGRKRKFSDDDIAAMLAVVEENGYTVPNIPWGTLPEAAGVEVQASDATIRRALRARLPKQLMGRTVRPPKPKVRKVQEQPPPQAAPAIAQAPAPVQAQMPMPVSLPVNVPAPVPVGGRGNEHDHRMFRQDMPSWPMNYGYQHPQHGN